MSDIFTDALNSSPGQLTEILINKITRHHQGELPDEVRTRLDRIIDTPGRAGLLGRVRLAADMAYLFDSAPSWTTSRLVPLFDWSAANAVEMWSAQKYSRYIGSPTLFRLVKRPFLEIFSRGDIPAEDLCKFAEWLPVILIANQAHGADYPLSSTEARSTLRRAGVRVLSTIGHRLAIEMERAAAGEKLLCWRNVIHPVFQCLWPLDVEMQTSATTFKLVQILLATGEAFPEACEVIIPFIRPEERRDQTTVFSISRGSMDLYQAAPSQMLDLIAAVVGEPVGTIYSLGDALSRVRAIEPKLADTRKFQRLLAHATAL